VGWKAQTVLGRRAVTMVPRLGAIRQARRPAELAPHPTSPGSTRRVSGFHALSDRSGAAPEIRAAWSPSPLPGCSFRGRDDEAHRPVGFAARLGAGLMRHESVRVVAVGAHAKRSQQGSATGEHRMGNRGQDPRCQARSRASEEHPVRGKGEEPSSGVPRAQAEKERRGRSPRQRQKRPEGGRDAW